MGSDDGRGAPYFPPPRARQASAPSAYREPQRVPVVPPIEPKGEIVSRPEPPESTSTPQRKTPVKPADDALSIEARMARDHAKSSGLANEWAARFVVRLGTSILGLAIVFGGMQILRTFDVVPRSPLFAVLLVPFVIVGSVWLLVWRFKRLVRTIQRTFDE